jgi:nicotinamidase-related amidase
VTKALLVIDPQNDYFPGCKFPLWNTEAVLKNTEEAMAKANAQGAPVIDIRHIAKGVAPFFNEGTPGAVHPCRAKIMIRNRRARSASTSARSNC